MTCSPARLAVLRLRRQRPIRVCWPAVPAAVTLLVFADIAARRPPVPFAEAALLVLHVSCVEAADAIAVAEWSADHSAELGASGPLFVAGQRTGARLAAAVALHARDRRWPIVAGQVLADPRLEPATDESPYAAPLSARSLAGVAPAVITASADGRRYAERLRRVGVEVTFRHSGLQSTYALAVSHIGERSH